MEPVTASSASRVLTEEILRQEGQDNGKLKVLIVKEVRKQGKSEYLCTTITTYDLTHVYVYMNMCVMVYTASSVRLRLIIM